MSKLRDDLQAWADEKNAVGGIDNVATFDLDELEEIFKRQTQRTYMFSFAPDAKLAVIEAEVPQEDAIATTGKTIKRFGWREGILHTIAEVERYMATGQLKNHEQRIRLNSVPKTLPNGDTYDACAACGYSPGADEAMWLSVVVTLDKQLENPPE